MLILLIIAYLIVNEEPNTFISVLFGKWISGGRPSFKKNYFNILCYVLCAKSFQLCPTLQPHGL